MSIMLRQAHSPSATLPRLSSLPISKTVRGIKSMAPLPLPPLSPSLESVPVSLLTPTTPTQASGTGLVLPPLTSQALPPLVDPSTSIQRYPHSSHQVVSSCDRPLDPAASTVTSLCLPPPPSPPMNMATNHSLSLPVSPDESVHSTHHDSLIQRLRNFTAPQHDVPQQYVPEQRNGKHELLSPPIRNTISDTHLIHTAQQRQFGIHCNEAEDISCHQQTMPYSYTASHLEQYAKETAQIQPSSEHQLRHQHAPESFSLQPPLTSNNMSSFKRSPLSPLSPQRIPLASHEIPECISTENSNNAELLNDNLNNSLSVDSTNTNNANYGVFTNQRSSTADDRPHACRKCNASFRRRDNLTAHVRAQHKGERPFRCEVCGFRFIKKDHAMKHWKVVHLKERPFICNQCDSRFGQRSDLNKHFRSVHLRIKPFKCDHCGLCFSHRGNQIRHQAVVHEKKKPFACVHCSFTFAEKSNLLKHCQAVHKTSSASMLPRTQVPMSMAPPMV